MIIREWLYMSGLVVLGVLIAVPVFASRQPYVMVEMLYLPPENIDNNLKIKRALTNPETDPAFHCGITYRC